MMKTALILIDIQNDYFPGGRYELAGPEQAAEKAKRMLDAFRQRAWPVFHIRHISMEPDAGFFLPGTTGSAFYEGCKPCEGEKILIKHTPDSFLSTGLKEQLDEERIDSLVICGMMTHMCIDTTVRSASGLGYPVELIEDACATRDLAHRGSTVEADRVQLSFMAALDGVFAKVTKAEEWLTAHQ